ncbi:MAG: stage II sporulation protein P [Clostridia bacterium]|nr:stage II sporulation protein P [Clostridia bacterium]
MKSSILRVVLVNFLCVCLCFLCGFINRDAFVSNRVTKQSKPSENTASSEAQAPQKEEEKPIEEPIESEVSSISSETVKETSAEAIKGNILSQYISPYSAKDSYDAVYLKNSTSLKVKIKDYLEGKINFSIAKNSEPQVLILHTHATETFMTEDKDYFTESFSSRSLNEAQNMVSVGKIVAEKLNAAGISTLHDTTLHDYPSYTKSYSRSAETVNKYLKQYPSIKVVLDLHRDAVTKENGDKVKLVTEIGGKKAAQVMLVMGSQSGSVTNFPKWEENFKLAVKLQNVMEKNYPTLARPLMLMSKNYNQSLTTGSLLLEFGTDANTLEEVHYSADLVGDCLVKLLSELN